ncbi:MAG: hypothetical protein H0T73_13625, partial [Ardenticatenales bacterium]|nr:hypothetical protein [Ardenticatenales bacterium]
IRRAARPPEVPPGAFGPQVSSLVALLNGRYRLSKRETQALLAEALRPLERRKEPSCHWRAGFFQISVWKVGVW